MVFSSLKFRGMGFGFNSDTEIFERVDYDFPMNSNVWISGDGGGGKSTLLRILAALALPKTGTYFVNDIDMNYMSFSEFMPYRVKIGYAMDYGGLLSNRTLRENIKLPVYYHKSDQTPELVEWCEGLISRFQMTSSADVRPAMVRGAMRRAACVVRSLAMKPELLLLDNPTEGMDPAGVQTLVRVIEEGRGEGWLKHVFVASQDELFVGKLDCLGVMVLEKKILGDQQEVEVAS